MIGNILVLKVFKEKLNSFNTTICRLVKADSPNSVFGLVEEPRQAKVKKDQRSQSSPKKRNQKGYCQTIDGQRLLRPFLAGNDWSPIEMSRLWRSPKTTAATISTIKQPRGCWRLLPTALLATVTQWSHMAETCQKKIIFSDFTNFSNEVSANSLDFRFRSLQEIRFQNVSKCCSHTTV